MKYLVSNSDMEFKNLVESCQISVSQFDHRAHLRLAYIYLVQESELNSATCKMRDALINLLKSIGIDPSTKYHETLTEAWVLAVRHFMNKTQHSSSADHFIEQNSMMLDSQIMLTHYSADVLFSDKARKGFVPPNLDPIPLVS